MKPRDPASRPTIVPTLRSHYDDQGNRVKVTIIDPPDLVGREVVRVEGLACFVATPGGRCGLVKGHLGICWDCAVDLIEQSGPWAVVVVPHER